jgi:hypothetical protein
MQTQFSKDEIQAAIMIDPKRIAVEYYFGELQYWKLPSIAATALEEGFV